MEDEKLMKLLDEKFAKVDGRFDGLETEIRHAHVKIEALRDDVKQNNELIHAVDEKVDRFRAETAANFKEVNLAIGTSNAVLINRIRKLEKAS